MNKKHYQTVEPWKKEDKNNPHIKYICYECGTKFGEILDDYICTWEHGLCDICGKHKQVTNVGESEQ